MSENQGEEEFPMIEVDRDVYLMESRLYERTKEIGKSLILTKQPTIKEGLGKKYGIFRDLYRDYLMFRLVIETAIDSRELVDLDLTSVSSDLEIILKNRKIQLSPNLQKLLQDYIYFRKTFDKTIFIQKIINDLNAREKISNVYSDEEMSEFINLALPKKLEKIEELVTNQLEMEEEVRELEEVNQDLDKIEQLEEVADTVAEKINDYKNILIFERKKGEYEFNSALFVSSSYTRLHEGEALELMDKESFPLEALQNTAMKNWQEAGIPPKQIEKMVGNRGDSLFTRSNELSSQEAVEMVKAGFTFENRSLF